MRPDSDTRKAIDDSLERMAEAMAQKNITAFMKLFAEDPNMMTIGMEDGSISIGTHNLKKRMEETFKEAESISLKYGWTGISTSGAVAWVGSHVTYNIKKKGKEAVSLSTRLSGVLEKQGEKWLWVNQHFSLPMPIEAPDVKVVEEAKTEEENPETNKVEGTALPPTEAPTEESSDLGDGFYDMG